jgi:phosphosulfolactate phosphohydrolase-like enzyme
VAALINATAAAVWAGGQGRDVVLVCSGELGAPSLEDQACAGVLVARLAAEAPAATLTPAAVEAQALGERYAKDLERLARDAPHARKLAKKGRQADVAVCLTLDTSTVVPVLVPNVDKLVSGPR